MGYVLANILMAIVKVIVLIYDVVTLPIYYIIQRPWTKRRSFREQQGRRISSTKTEVLYGSVVPSESQSSRFFTEKSIDTLYKLFDHMTEDPKRIDRPSMGTRRVIRMEKEICPDTGKATQKLALDDDYKWITNRQAAEKAKNFGKGLRELGLEPGDKVAIYAETRADWMLAIRGCFQHSITIVTLYTNLGIDGVGYGMSLTEAKAVIISQELLTKFVTVLQDLPLVQLVVVLEEPWIGEIPATLKELNKEVSCTCQLHPFNLVCEKGKESTKEAVPPSPQDTAVIMFTSGSTGVPKGVIQSHKNLISAFKSMYIFVDAKLDFRDETIHEESYVAFLPLAHIFEFLAENVLLLLGIKVGYSSPYTLTDTGTKIMKGAKGDLSILKPTLMCSVPLVLDRIYKGTLSKVKAKGDFALKLFEFGVTYNNTWMNRGYTTPILARLLFNKVREATGGKLRIVVSGGAPCSGVTQQFLRSVLGVKILQGYGLTETCATATVVSPDDLDIEQSGAPLPLVAIKIRSWDEGNYTIDDAEGPRGEIIVGGDHVTEGYYQMPELTESDYEISNGRRWFLTGDIGQVTEKGTIKIIDRKKDLVKLQMGEYVSLGKVESVLTLHHLIDNICISAKSTESSTVALIVPSRPNIMSYAETLNKASLSFEELIKDQTVIDGLAKSLSEFGLSKNLEKFEIPRRITLVHEEWTPDSGLVTAAMKLRRRQIDEKYREEIKDMYRQLRSVRNLSDSHISRRSGDGRKINPV